MWSHCFFWNTVYNYIHNLSTRQRDWTTVTLTVIVHNDDDAMVCWRIVNVYWTQHCICCICLLQICSRCICFTKYSYIAAVSTASAAAAVTRPSQIVMQAPCQSPSVASHPVASAAYQHSLTTHDSQNVSEAAQMKHDKDAIYGYDMLWYDWLLDSYND